MIAKTPNLMYRLNVQFTAYGRQTGLYRGVVKSCDLLQNFWSSNHITETAESKVVKFCTHVGYINSSNRMTYHQQKRHGYGHVTVLKFCRLSWCCVSRGFVSDSWATCLRRRPPPFWIFEIYNSLTVETVKRVELHHYAKFCQKRLSADKVWRFFDFS